MMQQDSQNVCIRECHIDKVWECAHIVVSIIHQNLQEYKLSVCIYIHL